MHTNIHQITQDTLQRYLAHFTDEAGRFDLLKAQLASGEDLFVRSNMTGHATASVVVLNEAQTNVLLIDHKFLQRWLPPGGHYEQPGDLWASGQREVAEETGVTNIRLHPWCVENGIPLDVDTHRVPANPKKAEGEHFHHDFRFLAIASSEDALVTQEEEVNDAKWVPLESLVTLNDRRLATLVKKLREIGLLSHA